MFGRCDKYADRTSVHSCFAYVLVSPLFIISVISIISVIVSVFYTLIGLFLHFGSALLNIGAVIYFLLYFNDRYKNSFDNLAQQIVPAVVIGACALMSLICAIDSCRRFIIKKKEQYDRDRESPYRPLDQGSIPEDSSDSDSEKE